MYNDLKKKEMDELQKLENQMWRQILGAPFHAPIATLRGEIGSSTVEGRDIKNKLEYLIYIFNAGSDLIKQIIFEMIENQKKFKWMK